MRLLVLGGTRFLGRAVSTAAAMAGDDVICAARGESGPVADGARLVRIDRAQPAAYAALADLGPFDAVVDVSSRPSHVRAALAALAPVAGHWVYVSSVSAYADNSAIGQTPATAPTLPAAPLDVDETDMEQYGPCKVAAEDAVRETAGTEHSFICRAGLIVGPEDPSDRFTYWPERIAADGEVLVPGAPDDAAQWIDVRDLAAWIVEAARGRVSGTYDGIGPRITRAEMLAGIASALGVQPRFTWVAPEFLTTHEINTWAGPRSLPMWLPVPEYAGMLAHDAGPSLAAGLVCRDLADTARATLAWRKGADDPDRPRRAGIDRATETRILAAWHAQNG